MSRGTVGGLRKGLGTLGEVRDRSGDPWGYPGRIGGPLWLSETGRGTLGEGRVGRLSGRSGMGLGTVGDVRDGSLDPR